METSRAKLLVLASGTATGGGSGFKQLVLSARTGVLWADIVVASNHERGGVWQKACELGMEDRCIHFPGPWTAEAYQEIVRKTGAGFVACSGWLKLVEGLDPATTINIHPGPLPEFGGKGMYGHHVHEAVMQAYRRDKMSYSTVCMHFVTPAYDDGPVFFRVNISIRPEDTPVSLGTRVNALEHIHQARITNLIVTRRIHWTGKCNDLVVYPSGYRPVLWAE